MGVTLRSVANPIPKDAAESRKTALAIFARDHPTSSPLHTIKLACRGTATINPKTESSYFPLIQPDRHTNSSTRNPRSSKTIFANGSTASDARSAHKTRARSNNKRKMKRMSAKKGERKKKNGQKKMRNVKKRQHCPYYNEVENGHFEKPERQIDREYPEHSFEKKRNSKPYNDGKSRKKQRVKNPT